MACVTVPAATVEEGAVVADSKLVHVTATWCCW